ncbi:MAG: flagellar hook-basal body complex protein, partial [Desulfobulbaceae bacterium]|nr:flagellar hook-basal body complex protein [Desulfobulbaceae bacterium]
NLSSTLSFGTEPAPQILNSPGAALVDTGSTKITLNSDSTGWDKMYDADGNKVQDGDIISFTGSNGEGTPVSFAYTVNFSNTVGDLLSSLESQFSCKASIFDGGLQLEDIEVGDSQLAISSISYKDSSGNGPLDNASLAQVFGADGSNFETIPDDRAHPSAISTTNYAMASKDLYKQQDGYASGYLMDVKVDRDGVVSGMYSNGKQIEQAQLVLADFVNYGGLRAANGNNYLASEDAGEISIYTPGQGGLGEIAGNALEMSNVDLARQFVDLITTQRTFQANSVTIKTADEVYQTTLQMMT